MSPTPKDANDSILDLMRTAVRSYANAIEERLAIEGIDGLPRNGGFVLMRLANGEPTIDEMIRGLGVTKQAVSQLIDLMASRGYVTRAVDPEDRRRVSLALTDKGRTAADAIAAGSQAIDEQLSRGLSASEISGLKTGLATLGQIALKSTSESKSGLG